MRIAVGHSNISRMKICIRFAGTLFVFISVVAASACSTVGPKPVSSVSQYCTQSVTANHRDSTWDRDPRNAENIVRTLENVPDAFQTLINDFGAVVVVFDGSAWDHVPSYEAGENPESVSGLFVSSTKEILINHNGHQPTDTSVSLELHEFGHAIDRMLADMSNTPYGNNHGYWVSDSPDFRNIHRAAMANPRFRLFMMQPHEESPQEFFAECFARFYHSDKSRESMKARLPECYRFFAKMENYVLTNHPLNLAHLEE